MAVMVALAVPTVAQLWATPLLVFHFNQWAWHSVALNAVAAPMVGVMTLVGFASALVALCGLPWVSGWLLWPLKPLAWLFWQLAVWGQQQGWALLTVASPPALTVVLWIVALLVLVGWVWPYQWPSPRRWAFFGLVLLLAHLPWLVQHVQTRQVVQRQPWQVWEAPVPSWLFYPVATLATGEKAVGQTPALVLLPANTSGWEAHQLAQRWRKTYGATQPTWVTVGHRPWAEAKQQAFAESLGLREANDLSIAHWPLATATDDTSGQLPVWQAWPSRKVGEAPLLWAVHRGQGLLVVQGTQAGYWGPDWGASQLYVPLARRVVWGSSAQGQVASSWWLGG